MCTADRDRHGTIFSTRRNRADRSSRISGQVRPCNKNCPRWPMKHAVVLLSGGLDSATTLAITRDEGYEIYAISFDYGQRHKIEIEAARKIANSLGVHQHRVIKIDHSLFAGSALTDDIDVPKNRD